MGLRSTNRALLADYLLGSQANQAMGRNYIKNPLPIRGVENITVSGATITKNTTTPLTSLGDFAVTLANNATDTVTWSLNTLDKELSGGNCELRFNYTASSIGSNVIAQIVQGSDVISASLPLLVSSIAQPVSVYAPCGDLSSATTIVVRNSTGNSGTSSLKISNVQYGKLTNVTSISQAQLVGGVVITGCNAAWQVSSTTFTNFPAAGSGCSYSAFGNALAPSTLIPGIRFSSLPAGEYIIVYEGRLDNNDLTNDTFFNFSDGTNSTREQSQTSNTISISSMVHSIGYNSTQSNITIQLQSRGTNGSSLQRAFARSTNSESSTIKVYKIPSVSEVALNNSNNNTARWGYFSTSSSSGGFVTSATYTTPTNANWNSGNFVSTQGVTAMGSNKMGFTFPATPAGRYMAFFTGSATGDSSAVCYIRLSDGSVSGGEGSYDPSGGGTGGAANAFGSFEWSSQADRTIEVQIQNTNGSNNCGLSTQDGLNGNGATARMTLVPLNNLANVPLLIGSLSSNSSGLERSERSIITGTGGLGNNCTSSPCTVYKQSGTWITGVTRSSTGSYQITLASGIFSDLPSCNVSVLATSGDPAYCSISTSLTSTGVGVNCWNSAGTLSDYQFSLRCQGPR